MKHEICEQQGAVVVSFQEDVDLDSSPHTREILLELVKRNQPVIVDLSGVTYIDSSGVASLVEALQTARKRGQKFSLAAVSEVALRVLRLARLDAVFTIHETVNDGIEASS